MTDLGLWGGEVRLCRCRWGRSGYVTFSILGDVESERRVGRESLRVHAVEHGDPDVDVVVEFDVVLSAVRAQQPADVLHYSSLEGERKGKEQGVEVRPVEPLPEVRAGGDQRDTGLVRAGCDGVGDGVPGSLAETTS